MRCPSKSEGVSHRTMPVTAVLDLQQAPRITFRFKGSKHAKMIRRTASNKTPMTLKQCISMLYLVVWNMAGLFSIWDVILPIDELHHFSCRDDPLGSNTSSAVYPIPFKWTKPSPTWNWGYNQPYYVRRLQVRCQSLFIESY